MSGNIFEAPRPVTLPPLFSAQELTGSADPFAKACAQATLGCDAGLVVYNISADRLRAAIVFAPEEPLEQAMAALCVCGVGFQNALGALAPPEVAVHLTWDGLIRVNGAVCGRLRAAAAPTEPARMPDWLVIGLELQVLPRSHDDPGLTPDETCLYLEGCADVSPPRLLEAWARHTLVWINRLEGEGRTALHGEWRGLVEEIGQEVTRNWQGKALSGTFLGVDENFGMLIRAGGESHLIPLSSLLENGEKS